MTLANTLRITFFSFLFFSFANAFGQHNTSSITKPDKELNEKQVENSDLNAKDTKDIQKSDSRISSRQGTFNFEQFEENVDVEILSLEEREALIERLKRIIRSVDETTKKKLQNFIDKNLQE